MFKWVFAIAGEATNAGQVAAKLISKPVKKLS